MTVLEEIYRQSNLKPSSIALIDKKSQVSYSELWLHIWWVKQYLEKQYKIEQGDRVLIAANKNPNFIYSYFALQYLGAVSIPVDELIADDRLNLILNETKPKLLIGIESQSFQSISWKFQFDSQLELVQQIQFPDEDLLSEIIFTTGTTGEPKGVLLTQRNISASAENINEFLQNTCDDVELLALPISHSFGLGRIRCVLSSGGTLVLLGNLVNSKRIFRLIEQHQVTGIGLVPASWEYIKRTSGTKLAEYAEQLRYIELGSAPLSVSEKVDLRTLFPTTRVCMHYGLTEASRSTFLTFSDTEHLDTIGRSSPNCNVVVKDDRGRSVLGQEGEICVKGEHVTKGYLNRGSENLFFGEYFKTGDKGIQDKEGYITYVGRINEIINVGGKKVSPIEVEAEINSIRPDIDVVCVGVDDEVLGQVVKAYFLEKDREKINLNEIDKYLKTKLETYKIPTQYDWIEDIPRTSSGKIQRQKLN